VGDVELAAPLTLAGIALLMLAGRGLDALTLGEAAARSLGSRRGGCRRCSSPESG